MLNQRDRMERLRAEYETLQGRVAELPCRIAFNDLQSVPYVERYFVTFSVSSIDNQRVGMQEEYNISIELLESFPQMPPTVYVLPNGLYQVTDNATGSCEIKIPNWNPEKTLLEVLAYIDEYLHAMLCAKKVEVTHSTSTPQAQGNKQDSGGDLGSRGQKISVLNVEDDSRPVTVCSVYRVETDNCIRSKQYGFLKRSDTRLFIESEACRQIFDFIGWGKRTATNRVEQAALMYGRLCEAKSLFSIKRWGEVYGIIPIRSECASEVSVNIAASDWAYASQQLDELNLERTAQGEEEYVIIGWMHTHPNTLEVSFSSLDVSLQKRIMNNDNLFGVVMNPHRRIFACYADADSKCCRAVLVTDQQLREEYCFDDTCTLNQSGQKTDGTTDTPVLQLKAMHKRVPTGSIRPTMYDVQVSSLGNSFVNIQERSSGSISLADCRHIASTIKEMHKGDSVAAIVIYYNTGELKPVAFIPANFIPEARRNIRQKKGYYLFSVVPRLPTEEELIYVNHSWGLWPERTLMSSYLTFENTIYFCDNPNDPQVCILFDSSR